MWLESHPMRSLADPKTRIGTPILQPGVPFEALTIKGERGHRMGHIKVLKVYQVSQYDSVDKMWFTSNLMHFKI